MCTIPRDIRVIIVLNIQGYNSVFMLSTHDGHSLWSHIIMSPHVSSVSSFLQGKSKGPKVCSDKCLFTTFSVQGINKNVFNRTRIPLYLVEFSMHEDKCFQVKTTLSLCSVT